MKILFVLIVIGIALLGRAVYIAQKIKKDPETKKYGNNPQKAIGIMAIIGAVLFAVGCIGLPVLDALKPTNELKASNNTTSRMTFEEFKNAYNENASEIMNETITGWSITEGEKADTARIDGEGYGFLVTMSKNSNHYVTGITFIFESTQNDKAFMLNNFRMYILILAIEPNTTFDEALKFIEQLAKADGKKLTTRSNTNYLLQNVQGNIVLSITL